MQLCSRAFEGCRPQTEGDTSLLRVSTPRVSISSEVTVAVLGALLRVTPGVTGCARAGTRAETWS